MKRHTLGPVSPTEIKLADEFDAITGGLWGNYSSKRKALTMLRLHNHYNPKKRQTSKFAEQYPHYHKDVSNLETIDIYQFLALMEMEDPSTCLGHALKKIAAGGKRGAKDTKKDILEAINSLHRYLEIYYPGYEDDGATRSPKANSKGLDPSVGHLPAKGEETPVESGYREADLIAHPLAGWGKPSSLIDPLYITPFTDTFTGQQVTVKHREGGDIVVTIHKKKGE